MTCVLLLLHFFFTFGQSGKGQTICSRVLMYVCEADGTRRGGFFERTASGDESIALRGWTYLELEKRLQL